MPPGLGDGKGWHLGSYCVGKMYVPPELAMRMNERLFAPLSDRENEVLALIGKRHSNKEIWDHSRIAGREP